MKKRQAIYPIVLTTLSVIIYNKWLTFSVFQYSDWWFFPAGRFKVFTTPSVWLTDRGFGSIDVTFWKLPIYFIYNIFGYFNLNSNIADLFVVFVPIIFLLPLFSFLLIRKITKSNIGALLGSVVFSFNTYFLAISTQGHEMINVAAAFCVNALLFFMMGLNIPNKSIRYFLASSLLLFISTFYDIRISYIILFVMATYFLYFLIFIERLDKVEILFLLKKISLAFFGFVLLSLYWFLPQIKTGFLFDNPILNRSLFGNNFWDLLSSFSLFHPFWGGSSVEWFTVQPIPFYFWLIPIIAFSGFLLKKKNKYITFFTIISLVGIFLTKQVDQPFSQTYQWLYTYLPGFGAFREASKFYFLIALGYSVLVGSFIDWLWRNCNKNKWQSLAKYGLTFMIAGLFLWNTKPIVTGEIGTMFVPRHIPKDYLVLNDFILKQPEYFRTMWVPRDPRWAISTSQKSKISNTDVIDGEWGNLLETYNENEKLIQNRIVNVFKTSFSDALFDISSIKYVIIPIQDIENKDNFFIYYGGEENPDIRQWYIDELNKISWLTKIDIGTKDLVVYENKDYKEPIYSFSKLINFDSLQNLENKYSFNKKMGNDFYFISGTSLSSNSPLVKIKSLFENMVLENGAAIDNVSKIAGNTKLYVNLNIINLKKYLSLNGEKAVGGIVPMNEGLNTFEYKNPEYTSENIILNPSFEEGLWQKKVSDCHNYDNNGILAMVLNKEEKTDGLQSLQLEATRHNACTAVAINVVAGGSYLFSFDYQSLNAKNASYYLDFNNKEKTKLSEDLPIKDKNWNTFSKTIKVPDGATTASLYVYVDSKDEKTNIINRYDNFKMIQVTDLNDAYYLVSEPEVKLIEPTSITFDLINPTKKLVHIKGATTPFYLAMSENYHEQWQLQFNNSKNNGFFNSWVPFIKPDRIQDEYHYKLNDFLNAWYIDTAQVCESKVESQKSESGCIKNADGSYDIEMTIEFFPQRWFYLGLLISGTTLVGCLGYLGYEGVKRIRVKIKKISRASTDGYAT